MLKISTPTLTPNHHPPSSRPAQVFHTPNHQPNSTPNQNTPNHQYSPTTVSIGPSSKHPPSVASPPLQPNVHLNHQLPPSINPPQSTPQTFNNNYPKPDESSELFSIYQRRQQQQQQVDQQHQMAGHQPRMYEHFNNNHMPNSGVHRYHSEAERYF